VPTRQQYQQHLLDYREAGLRKSMQEQIAAGLHERGLGDQRLKNKTLFPNGRTTVDAPGLKGLRAREKRQMQAVQQRRR